MTNKEIDFNDTGQEILMFTAIVRTLNESQIRSLLEACRRELKKRLS